MIRFNTGDTNFNTIIKFWINNETMQKNIIIRVANDHNMIK